MKKAKFKPFTYYAGNGWRDEYKCEGCGTITDYPSQHYETCLHVHLKEQIAAKNNRKQYGFRDK